MFERMLDKTNVPTQMQLYAYCKDVGVYFEEINALLMKEGHTNEEIRFPYGKTYGWGVCHRKGKKLICDIFAEAGAFTVMLRLSDEQYQKAYDNVSSYTKNYIENKYPCGGGGWIQYRVSDEKHVEDIIYLLRIKIS